MDTGPKGFTYKSYSFVDKDPIIDEVRTVLKDSGVNYAWVHEHSGVSSGTLANWFDGPTKRPQAATINAVLRCMGYKLGVVPFAEAVRVEPPMRQSQRHVVQMSKYKKAKR